MTSYEKLKKLITEIDILIQKNVIPTSFEFRLWKSNVEAFLIEQYGANSPQWRLFGRIHFQVANWNNPGEGIISACEAGLREARQALSSYLEDLEAEQPLVNSQNSDVQKTQGNFDKVFIVHGHDSLKDEVARILDNQGIKWVILQDEVSPGLATIIEKFETNSVDADAAICLFTADDVGGLATSKTRTKRARQNVVLEAGFFIGKLGRDRVIIIQEDGVEIPSDLAGVDLTKANKSDWKTKVLQALEKIGYAINYQIAFSKNR